MIQDKKIYSLNSLTEVANHVWDAGVQLFDDDLKWTDRDTMRKQSNLNVKLKQSFSHVR